MNPTCLYVGALYAIAVWLARRSGVMLRRRIAFFFYLLVLLFLFKPMTQQYVGVPVDCVTRIPPWALVDRAQTVNCDMNDIVTQMVPWAKEVRDDWKGFRVPLWSARSGSGSVLLANMQSAALSPLRLLALPLPLGESMTAEAAMKMLVALTFAFLFCRRRGYSDLASAAGAVAFGFCTFIVVWLHFAHATVAAFLPAALLAADLFGEQFTRARFAFAVVVWVCIFFGGHPETALHIVLFTAAYVLWSPHGVRRLAAAFVISLLVAAPLLAPFLEALPHSDRYQSIRSNPPGVTFTDRSSAFLLVQPGFFGVRPIEKPWGPSISESISGFAGILGFAGWLALLVDVIATRRWRAREFFFVVMAVLIVAVMFDWPLIGTGFHKVFAFAANTRIRLLFAFVMAMLAAAIIDLIERRRWQSVLAGVAGAALLLVAMVAATQFPNAMTHTNTLRSILPSAVVLILAVLSVAPPTPAARIATLALLAAMIIELFAAGIRWNPVVDARLMYPETPLVRRLVELRNESRTPLRIVGLGASLYPNSGAIYGFEDIRTHDPMANARYLGVLRVVTGYNTQDYFAHFQNADSPLLDFLNVVYVVADPGAELDHARYELVYDGRDGRIYRNRHVLQRFYAVRNVVLEFRPFAYAQRLSTMRDFAETAMLSRLPVTSDEMRGDLLAPRPPDAPEPYVNFSRVSDTKYTVWIRAPRNAVIVSSIPFWPGWRVEVNGNRVEPLVVNGAFLGFVVPPGDSATVVQYVPMMFYAGLIVSAIALAGLVVGATMKR